MKLKRGIKLLKSNGLTDVQKEQFINLLSQIEIDSIVIDKMQVEKLVDDLSILENEDISVNISFAIREIDPQITDSTLLLKPLVKIELLVNEKVLFFMRFVYSVVYIIKPENKKNIEAILSDSDIKDYFISKQVNKQLWPYLREEVSSTMSKCGLKPIYLQLLR